MVDEPLAAQLVRMARFRNVLVHRCWTVRRELVLEYARERLTDFEQSLAQVGRYADRAL